MCVLASLSMPSRGLPSAPQTHATKLSFRAPSAWSPRRHKPNGRSSPHPWRMHHRKCPTVRPSCSAPSTKPLGRTSPIWNRAPSNWNSSSPPAVRYWRSSRAVSHRSARPPTLLPGSFGNGCFAQRSDKANPLHPGCASNSRSTNPHPGLRLNLPASNRAARTGRAGDR